MRGVNKVIIVGNLGADPEIRQFPNGGMVANISVATSESWTDKQTGEKKEATEWHRIQFSNRLAEIAQQYLRKGSSVYIEGSLKTRKWQDQNGQDRYTTEIRASNMQMLGGNPNAAMGGQQGGQMNSPMGGNAPMEMGQPNQMGGYQGQNNQAQNNQGGYQNQQAPQNNGFQNQPNTFNAPPAQQQQPFQQPQQAQPVPIQPANPQGMAMSDAPADDDIPF